MIGTPRIAGQTYAGRGVRYQPSGEITAARNANRLELHDKFQPSSNPTNDLAVEINQIPLNWGNDQSLSTSASEWESERSVPTVPSGNLNAYDFLKSRAEAGRIGDSNDRNLPVFVGSKPIPHFLEEGVDGALYQSSKGNAIWVNPSQEPLMKAATLSHELGHHVLGHRETRKIPTGMEEAEAEAVAYGVMNRMYPWNNAQKKASADYIAQSQLGASDEIVPVFKNNIPSANPIGFENVQGWTNPGQYLDDENVQDYIDNAIQNILPNPRKPFKNIVQQLENYDPRFVPTETGFRKVYPTEGLPNHGMNTSPTRNLNPVTQTYQQEELMAQAALSDRYSRYGY